MHKPIAGTALLASCAIAAAYGQPTTFTYQGQLKHQGLPVNDQVDMRFWLFDSDTGVAPVAGPIEFNGIVQSPVAVTHGLFSVELDFGSKAFQQGELWLAVEVRTPHSPNDIGAYTALDPRQRMTAAPFALSVPGLATSDTGVEVSGDVHTTGDVIASAFSSNSPLIFKVNPANVECARFDDVNCYFGVGTAAPQARLHIGGAAGVDGLMFPDGSLMTTAAGIGGGDGFWTATGMHIYKNNPGNVGIGRTNPSYALDVRATTGLGVRLGLEGNGGGALILANNTNDNRIYLEGFNSAGNGSAAEMLLTGYAGGFIPQLTLRATNTVAEGNVGIGIATPASRLDIVGQDGLRITGYQPFLTLTDSNNANRRTRIQAVDGNFINFFTEPSFTTGIPPFQVKNDGIIVVGQDAVTAVGYQPFMTLSDSAAGYARGRMQNAGGSLHFFTEASFASGLAPLSVWNTGHAVQGTHTGSSSTAGLYGLSHTNNGNGVIGEANAGGSAYGVWGRSVSGIGGYFSGGSYALVAAGRAKVNVLEVVGADMAEKFPSSDDLVEPGTVMEIDPEHPGHLRVARDAYSTRVAGVVSGAGDIPTGTVLGNFPGSENQPAIALSGRVWVRCDAGESVISPGDLLTTSQTPGHAMRATDRDRANGAVLGKAMTTLAQGERGLVLVLVNLQ